MKLDNYMLLLNDAGLLWDEWNTPEWRGRIAAAIANGLKCSDFWAAGSAARVFADHYGFDGATFGGGDDAEARPPDLGVWDEDDETGPLDLVVEEAVDEEGDLSSLTGARAMRAYLSLLLSTYEARPAVLRLLADGPRPVEDFNACAQNLASERDPIDRESVFMATSDEWAGGTLSPLIRDGLIAEIKTPDGKGVVGYGLTGKGRRYLAALTAA